jgi:hypothetical protein
MERSFETVDGTVAKRLQMVALISCVIERPVRDWPPGANGGDDVADVSGGAKSPAAGRERDIRLQGEDDCAAHRLGEHPRQLGEDILGQHELENEGSALNALAGERHRRISRHPSALGILGTVRTRFSDPVVIFTMERMPDHQSDKKINDLKPASRRSAGSFRARHSLNFLDIFPFQDALPMRVGTRHLALADSGLAGRGRERVATPTLGRGFRIMDHLRW